MLNSKQGELGLPKNSIEEEKRLLEEFKAT